MDWPKKPIEWIEDGVLHISIPFTWNLPEVHARLHWPSRGWDKVIVGGPAVELMPMYFMKLSSVETRFHMPGVLQRVNPRATRTTIGCPRKCKFCGIGQGKIEAGGFLCLKDWPDLPVICDNNLLAAPRAHFDKVIDRLKKHKGVDFNQGLDARLLTEYHAERIRELKLSRPGVRLALDSRHDKRVWSKALGILLKAGIARRYIGSYVLVGYNTGPDEAWSRCKFVEEHSVNVRPMWFHTLDQLQANIVTNTQKLLGWNDYERKRIMRWYYQHEETPKPADTNSQLELF